MLVALYKAISTKDVRYTDCSTAFVPAAWSQNTNMWDSRTTPEDEDFSSKQKSVADHDFVGSEGGTLCEGSVLLLSAADQPRHRIRQRLMVHRDHLVHHRQSLHHQSGQPKSQRGGRRLTLSRSQQYDPRVSLSQFRLSWVFSDQVLDSLFVHML